MTDYISRREAEKRMADLIGIVTNGRCPTWNEVHEALYDLPVIELVRCKDCKWFIKKFENEGRCIKHDNDYHDTDWFCADGERRCQDDSD